MSRDRLVVLGATGSIGRQTLAIAEARGLEVVGVAARRASDDLASIAKRWPSAQVVVAAATAAETSEFLSDVGRARVEFGGHAMADLARTPATVVNGVVGIAGFPASVAALQAGNRLALANKESLVAGGGVIASALRSGGGELLPVDSEHSAIHQLTSAVPSSHVDSLVLTASGGPFRGWTRPALSEVTPEMALAHPTWNMGNRITIDSATLANKGLEVIEAAALFGVTVDDVEVVVHPQSVVHSLVRLVDGALLAHIGETTMRHAIEYSIFFPDRASHPEAKFDLPGLALGFEAPDLDTFRALALAYDAGRSGGSAPASFNAADEIAVAAFLQGRIGFLAIAEVIERTMGAVAWSNPTSVEDVIEVDRDARAQAAAIVGRC